MPALKRKSAPSETPVGTQPMMGQLYAHGATVGSPFQFEADRFVQRPHAFREQLPVEYFLRDRVPRGQLAGRAAPLVDKMQRLRALEREQHHLS